MTTNRRFDDAIVTDSELDKLLAPWVKSVQSTEPTDRSVAENAVRNLYLTYGLNEPSIIWCDSLWQISAIMLVFSIHGDFRYIEARAERLDQGLSGTLWRRLWNVIESQGLRQKFEKLQFPENITSTMCHVSLRNDSFSGDFTLSNRFVDASGEIVSKLSEPGIEPTTALYYLIVDQLSELGIDSGEIFATRSPHRSGPLCCVPPRFYASEDRLWNALKVIGVQDYYKLIGLPIFSFHIISCLIRPFLMDDWGETGESFDDLIRQKLRVWKEVSKSVFALVLFNGLSIICERPNQFVFNHHGCLHNQAGPAVTFSDGYGEYFLDGFAVKREFFEQPECMTLDDVEEQCTIDRFNRLGSILSRYGIDRYIGEFKVLQARLEASTGPNARFQRMVLERIVTDSSGKRKVLEELDRDEEFLLVRKPVEKFASFVAITPIDSTISSKFEQVPSYVATLNEAYQWRSSSIPVSDQTLKSRRSKRQEWIEWAGHLKSTMTAPLDEKEVREALSLACKTMGEPVPDKIVFCQSPLQMQLMSTLIMLTVFGEDTSPIRADIERSYDKVLTERLYNCFERQWQTAWTRELRKAIVEGSPTLPTSILDLKPLEGWYYCPRANYFISEMSKLNLPDFELVHRWLVFDEKLNAIKAYSPLRPYCSFPINQLLMENSGRLMLGYIKDIQTASIVETQMKLASAAHTYQIDTRISLVCERPISLFTDSRGALHNTSGPAITYADGFSVYCGCSEEVSGNCQKDDQD
ncbi:MAG: hypothetical protein K2Z81_15600 [Cyanobacteria bacterium]|nr:hypothetical protein [Cyanobacteriota bacterium]